MTHPSEADSSSDELVHLVAPTGLAPAHGYSQVVVGRGRLVVVAGQMAVDQRGSLVGAADPPDQVRQVFVNLRAGLAAAGAGFADVVKLTYYVTDLAVLSWVGAVARDHLDPNRLPASTAVQVQALVHPSAVVEVDALAVLP